MSYWSAFLSLNWDEDTQISTVASHMLEFTSIVSELLCESMPSSYLHRCGCWMLTGNQHCTGNSRIRECSHSDGGSTAAGYTRQCLSHGRREISSHGIMAVHCCCLLSRETLKLIALD